MNHSNGFEHTASTMDMLTEFRSGLSGLSLVANILWGFIESDFFTFAIPNTTFGMMGALAAPVLVRPKPVDTNILAYFHISTA